MKHTQSLPEPSVDALWHSETLVDVIRETIKDNGGSISFRRYMEMALYQPQLGYYVAGTHKIGKQGDFTTAPEISPFFSQCIANQCAEVLVKIGGNACILELGAGSGAMAVELLVELEKQNKLPKCYFILDLSPDLVQRQQQKFLELAPQLMEKIEWITDLPKSFDGIILGNEVLDAMPVDVFTVNKSLNSSDKEQTDIYEHHVIYENGKLTEQLQLSSDAFRNKVIDLNISADTIYTSEFNPNIQAWLKRLNTALNQGLILLIDYGYTHQEYYLPDRNKGTLICHYQHLVNDAPLLYPGLQDITANVNFTAVAESADAIGFHVAGFIPQAHFLANAGLEQFFLHAIEKSPDTQYAYAQQVRTLSLPSEMGERFKCIALTKEYDEALVGFSQFDQRFRL